jgi:Protein of unknown function (DUF2853)
MSKFDEKMALYKEMLGSTKDLGGVDDALLTAVAKGLGPSIYNEDSSKVSCSDNTELERVKTNFLIKKLGLADSPALDTAISEVCEQLGSSNRNKHRAVFYYLLVKKLGKESIYG